jgi:U3 small nucleolar RNA-associated protein 25
MQNFDHVIHMFEHLNRLPTEQRDTDINRIRLWALEGLAARFRQTIVLSSFVTPELARLWRQQCRNFAGKHLVSRPPSGSILAVIPKISQVWVSVAFGNDAGCSLVLEPFLPA